MPSALRAGFRRGDGLLGLVVWGVAIATLGLFSWVVGDVGLRGVSELSIAFLRESPADAGRAGGIAPILVSTGLILLVCLTAAIPIGVGAAALLAEFTRTDGALGRTVRVSLDVLSGVPSIVFGLFGNVFFCVTLGLGFSIVSGGLTLACMVLPLVIRATEEGFRSVPDEIRQGAAALGFSRASTFAKLLLPAALPGLGVGLALGIGRALAETAALLFTSGYVDRMPTSLSDSGRALSIHIYDLAMNVTGGEPRACATALVLVAVLVTANMAAASLTTRASSASGIR
ncbi:MAG: phosphate ABC transporter permease PstA [Myxococcota bacterium]|nr:phosphate ABC transporter permease PstA [Myxococcota bacterium]